MFVFYYLSLSFLLISCLVSLIRVIAAVVVPLRMRDGQQQHSPVCVVDGRKKILKVVFSLYRFVRGHRTDYGQIYQKKIKISFYVEFFKRNFKRQEFFIAKNKNKKVVIDWKLTIEQPQARCFP